jgi:hypothetical protein
MRSERGLRGRESESVGWVGQLGRFTWFLIASIIVVSACGGDDKPPPIGTNPDGPPTELPGTDPSLPDGVTAVVPCAANGATTTWPAVSGRTGGSIAVALRGTQLQVAYAHNPGFAEQVFMQAFDANAPSGDPTPISTPLGESAPNTESLQVRFATDGFGVAAYTDSSRGAPQSLITRRTPDGVSWPQIAADLGQRNHVQAVRVAMFGTDRVLWAWVQRRENELVRDAWYAVTDAQGNVVHAPAVLDSAGQPALDVAIASNSSTASLTLLTESSGQNALWVTTLDANLQPRAAASLLEDERSIIAPISSVRVNNDSTLVAWSEHVAGGNYRVRLRQLLDDGTRIAEQRVDSEYSADLPALATLYGVPALAFRAKLTSVSYAAYAGLRMPDGSPFGDGELVSVAGVVNELTEVDLHPDYSGLGVAWATPTAASFGHLVCTD